MGRPSLLQNGGGGTIASAGYNWAGQMTSLSLPIDRLTETRTYDPKTLQLTRIQTLQGATPIMDMTYAFTAGQNNGRISSATDGVLSETVNYTYDSLNRLVTAQATNNSWGNSYTYDGFGNLTAKTVTVGSAPTFSAGYDPATNRQVGLTYDANGNVLLPQARYGGDRASNGYYNFHFDTYNPWKDVVGTIGHLFGDVFGHIGQTCSRSGIRRWKPNGSRLRAVPVDRTTSAGPRRAKSFMPEALSST
jgi:hypothetical protein